MFIFTLGLEEQLQSYSCEFGLVTWKTNEQSITKNARLYQNTACVRQCIATKVEDDHMSLPLPLSNEVRYLNIIVY